MPLSAHQPQSSRAPRDRDTPDKAWFKELGFKFLTHGSLDVEEGKDTGDVEEKGSESEVFSGADSAGRKPHGRLRYTRVECDDEGEFLPSARPKNPFIRVRSGGIKFPIFQVPFRVEFVRLGIDGFIIAHCPIPLVVSDRLVNTPFPRVTTHQIFSMTVAPAGMK